MMDLKPNMEKWGLKKRVYFLLTQDEQNRDDKSEVIRENNCQIRLLIQGKKKIGVNERKKKLRQRKV